MELDEKSLGIFLYMYSMKDDLLGFKQILSKINVKNNESVLRLAFSNACERNSFTVVNYILKAPEYDFLNKNDYEGNITAISHRKNSELMKILLTNEKEVLPIETLKNIILTKKESMVEIFLDLISEFNIKFNEVEKSYINENKKELFEKLENQLEEKPKQLKAKI